MLNVSVYICRRSPLMQSPVEADDDTEKMVVRVGGGTEREILLVITGRKLQYTHFVERCNYTSHQHMLYR